MPTNKPFDSLVFIGRFQPFHKGHQYVIDKALKNAKKLILLIGSSHQARSTKNPFTFSERADLIRKNLPKNYQTRVIIKALSDYTYDDESWVLAANKLIESEINLNEKTGIIGHNKDESTYYLGLFKNLYFFEIDNFSGINATNIRHSFFKTSGMSNQTQKSLSDTTVEWLSQFKQQPEFNQLADEFDFIESFQKSWANTPNPVNFVTADSVIIHQNKILLVTRKNIPGKGLLALPGGYVNTGESCLVAAIREASEETQIGLDHKQLKDALVNQKVFDQPSRSQRGRIITHVFYFQLNSENQPTVSGSNDAEKAAWYDIDSLDQSLFFEDHYFIIKDMLS